MWKEASGTYLGVSAGWYQGESIDESAMAEAFDSLRAAADEEGCEHFPTREDCAAHPVLFDAIYDRYAGLTGERPNGDAFRRHIYGIHKGGGTPE